MRLLEASLTAAPATDPAETAAREQRLATLYRDLAGKYPDRAGAQNALGDYARRHGRPDEALGAFRRAQALEPGDAATADAIGSIELQGGHTVEASREFQRAVEARPDYAPYRYTLANVLFLFRHDIAAAPPGPDAEALLVRSLAEFRRAAELEPGNLQYAQSYAETFYIFAHPDWEQARTAWKAVRALSGADTDFANVHLARVSLRMKRPEEAESYLALVRNPKFAPVRAKLHEQASRMPPAVAPTAP